MGTNRLHVFCLYWIPVTFNKWTILVFKTLQYFTIVTYCIIRLLNILRSTTFLRRNYLFINVWISLGYYLNRVRLPVIWISIWYCSKLTCAVTWAPRTIRHQSINILIIWIDLKWKLWVSCAGVACNFFVWVNSNWMNLWT